MRTRNSVWIARRVFSLLALLPLLFASRSVLFVSPYYEVTDRAANDVLTKTAIFIVHSAATTDKTGQIVSRSLVTPNWGRVIVLCLIKKTSVTTKPSRA